MDIKKYSNNFLLLIFIITAACFSIKNLSTFISSLIKDKSYEYITEWGSYGEEDGRFKSITGIAADGNFYIYTVDHLNNRIQKFDSSGHFILKYGSYGSGKGYFNDPRGIAVDSRGFVYVADTGNNLVQKFDSSGKFIIQWGGTGFWEGHFRGPEAISTDGEDCVYVSDGGGKIHLSCVQKFDSSGKFLCKWIVCYNRSRLYSHRISDISVDRDGSIYILYWNEVPFSVPDYGVNTSVYKFDREGNFIEEWKEKDLSRNKPTGITLDGKGNIFVCYLNRNFVYKYDLSGRLITWLIPEDEKKWHNNHPSSMAVDVKGNVYVADFSNYSIQKFALSSHNKKNSPVNYIRNFYIRNYK